MMNIADSVFNRLQDTTSQICATHIDFMGILLWPWLEDRRTKIPLLAGTWDVVTFIAEVMNWAKSVTQQAKGE